MREILFRGKQNEGRWAEGVYFKHDTVKVCFSSDDPKPRHLIIQDGFCDWGFEPPIHCVDVNPKTVGQYTGLTDKNGKKIFEGDIIECWSEGVKARGTVQQNRGGLWIIYPAWQKRIMWGLCPNEDGSTDVEIIGNIHDNPELLEVSGNG
jgi:uncharacterized phage protein (TIGR01671 family)